MVQSRWDGYPSNSQSEYADVRATMVDRLRSLQRGDGGWITDYDRAGRPLGEANVETTALALLALDRIDG